MLMFRKRTCHVVARPIMHIKHLRRGAHCRGCILHRGSTHRHGGFVVSRDTESRPGTARVPGHAPNFRDTRVPAHMSASWDTLTLYWDSADASWDTCFLGHADTLLAQPCPGTRLRVPGRPHTVLGHVHRVLGHVCPGTRGHAAGTLDRCYATLSKMT